MGIGPASPLTKSHRTILESDMRPSAQLALIAVTQNTNDRELLLAIELLAAHAVARNAELGPDDDD